MTKISMTELENSKVFVSKSETLRFLHPMDYLSPFIDILSPLNPEWNIEVEKDVENAETDGTKNVSYGRVAIKAKLPELYGFGVDIDSLFNDLYSEIGMVYALDTSKPEMKVGNGKRVSVCTNQCIFGTNNLTSILLTSSNREKLYDDTKRYADNLDSEISQYKARIERMHETKLVGKAAINERIGKIFWDSKKTNDLGINIASNMLTLLQDSNTIYTIKDNQTNDWTIYNALTQSLKKSSIIDEPSKVLFLQNIFSLN